jgi:hypothetical protein
MIDPAARENWIDSPSLAAGPPTDPPDEIDRALDALADAIGRVEGGDRGVLGYRPRAPIPSKTGRIFSQLTSSRLVAFLERHSGRDRAIATAVMPSLAASGAADRLARAQVFLRLMTASRLYALQRACDAAALRREGTRP